ncbi:hypothetical protein HaLaN_01077 [Haematococcus lacustris]|uniref:Uncharacterized protein n=1 Tax=Haematococcus lacustris TaxID=44745 RepID=A0A699YHE5_HAELA|nr:hypothetical protein HaLaN_01077 [Haematococcus lacustris]
MHQDGRPATTGHTGCQPWVQVKDLLNGQKLQGVLTSNEEV